MKMNTEDPFLIDKMRNEKEGILLWALEGLHRLIQNNYQFTISEHFTIRNVMKSIYYTGSACLLNIPQANGVVRTIPAPSLFT